MNDVSKNELSLEELGQVSGGLRYRVTQLDRGDCFTSGDMRFYSRDSYPHVGPRERPAFDKYTGDTYHGIRVIPATELSSGGYVYSAALSDKNYQPR